MSVMPKRSSKPRDLNSLAAAIVAHSTSDEPEADPDEGKNPAAPMQTGVNTGIAFFRGGFVVVICADRLRAEFFRQRRNQLARTPDQHLQATTQSLQGPGQFFHTVPDEFDAPVSAVGQMVQNLRVEDENAMHLPRVLERVVERGMVMAA